MINQASLTRRRLSLSLKSIVLLITCLFLITSACASTLTWIYVKLKTSRKFSYAIVFDAGSSHTQMIIYRWPGDKSNGKAGTSLVEEVYTFTEEPGINNVVGQNRTDVEINIRQYFRPFVQKANKIVPLQIRKDTIVMLGATAGMRILAIKNLNLSKRILNSIRLFFQCNGYLVSNRDIRIISGEEEALYAWISINTITSRIHPRTRKLIPYGALDLGGASTQIAFATEDLLETNIYPSVKLFGNKYNLAAHSFLCLGKSEIHTYYDYSLITKNKKETIIRDPCTVVGDRRVVDLAELSNNPCHLGINYKQWKAKILPETKFTIAGTGNATVCQTIFESILVRTCKNNICFLNHTHISSIPERTHFLGFSAFYYIWNYMGKPKTIEEYKLNLMETCLMRKADHEKQAKSKKELKYLLRLCFDGWYSLALLKAYGIDEDMQNNRLQRLSTINNKSVGWAYGYMINQTNMIPETYPSFTPFYITTHTLSMCLMWIITLLCLFLFFLFCFRIRACEK
ncbi:hypothetical protein GJ496_007677 [Pomphorhynchus laevis]|nr:hypothetical protein GJ496_007677 [Pomphorhynchus laevis]